MVKLTELIPEKKGEEFELRIDTDDGALYVAMGDEVLTNTTFGNGKILLLALIHIYGDKFVKQMMKVKMNWEETP